MPDKLDDFFQCVPTPKGWAYQTGIVRWPHPHTPELEWITVRRWKTPPDAARLARARKAVLAQRRFFLTCSICHQVQNIGHMHGDDVCQGCASRESGVLY